MSRWSGQCGHRQPQGVQSCRQARHGQGPVSARPLPLHRLSYVTPCCLPHRADRRPAYFCQMHYTIDISRSSSAICAYLVAHRQGCPLHSGANSTSSRVASATTVPRASLQRASAFSTTSSASSSRLLVLLRLTFHVPTTQHTVPLHVTTSVFNLTSSCIIRALKLIETGGSFSAGAHVLGGVYEDRC